MNHPAQNPYAASADENHIGGSGSTIKSTSTTGLIITAALIGGLLMITGIITYLVLSEPSDEARFRFGPDTALFLGIGYLLFISSAVASVFLAPNALRPAAERLRQSDQPLPKPLTATSPLPPDAANFLGASMTSMLIGHALLEGPAVVNAILMLLDKNFAHAIPIALAVVGIALRAPTEGKLKSLLENAKM